MTPSRRRPLSDLGRFPPGLGPDGWQPRGRRLGEPLERFLAGAALERDYLIVDGGKVVSPSYSYAFER